jgi:hypothetical protein
VTEETLRIYPLRVGSSWVYDSLSYDENQDVIWRVTETVVDAFLLEGYYVAVLEESVELLQGDPPLEFPFVPEAGIFWRLIDGNKIYRFNEFPESDLKDAWLEVILPFPKPGEGWYPDPVKRAEGVPDKEGYRTASAPYQDSVAPGRSYVCYNMVTKVNDGKQEATFCETIGFFYFERIDFDQPLGSRIELSGYSLQ